jgi:dTDP-4-dehydrorhamnose reductase
MNFIFNGSRATDHRKRILIAGAKGQLGQTFQDVLSGHDLILADREELDITDAKKVDNYLEAKKPEIVINCAAYTAVDKAEEEPEVARKINSLGAKNLAEAAKKMDSLFFHFSTDFVFDGDSGIPYNELQTPRPLSVYGKTKLEGEKLVAAVGGKYFILRTSWLYSPHGKNFVKTIAKLSHEKDELKIVSDQIGSPTYTYDLAFAVKQLSQMLEAGSLTKKPPPSALRPQTPFGLYHFSGEGECSWYDFAKEIVQLANGKSKVLPQTGYEYAASRGDNITAERPSYSVLNCGKIHKLGIKTPLWQGSLKKCIEILKNNKEL